MSTSEPTVISVVLNTNRRADTLACLASLRQSTYLNLRAIVLDNDSADGSVDAIRAGFPEVQIVRLEENHGYAGNNNVGIQAAVAQGADWVLVLNEDTVLDPRCVAELVRAGESDDRIGVVGPMVYHFDEPNVIQSAGGMLGPRWQSIHLALNEVDDGRLQSPRSVEWVSGCAIMVRRLVIEGVGMLDARFFYYWEETEWCLRAGRAGWRVVHVPTARVWHKGVQRDYHPKPSVTYYSTRNRLLMLAKHRAPVLVWALAWAEILRTLAAWTLKPNWRAMRGHRDAMMRGTLDFLRQRWGQMPS